MQELQCHDIKAYLDLLKKSDELRQECEKRMTVSISRFFRDRQFWRDLEDDLLPRIIERKDEALKVWSAGCARGEEVYSLKIVWDRLNKKYPQLPEIEIVATDMHPDYIDKARAGVYAKSSMKEFPQEVQEQYFEIRKSGNRFDIKAEFKKGVEWKVRDIFSNSPGTEFDIIFLRNNLLTYYKTHLKIEGLNRILKALVSGGWLIVGSHEKLPSAVSYLQRHRSIPWAYRKDI